VSPAGEFGVEHTAKGLNSDWFQAISRWVMPLTAASLSLPGSGPLGSAQCWWPLQRLLQAHSFHNPPSWVTASDKSAVDTVHDL